MSVTDFIADQITVIRNAIRVGKKTVLIKRSNTLEEIMRIMKEEGFIENYKVMEDNRQGQIKVYLKYQEDGTPVMETLKRVSKPGRRAYTQAEDINSVRGGVGISILSTSQGLLTGEQARNKGIGGEVICQIW